MPKNPISAPYEVDDGVWCVDEKQSENSSVVHEFAGEEAAHMFVIDYNQRFDPEDKDMWTTVLNCLQDDEDGQGYLFDHFKAIESQIKHWMETNRG